MPKILDGALKALVGHLQASAKPHLDFVQIRFGFAFLARRKVFFTRPAFFAFPTDFPLQRSDDKEAAASQESAKTKTKQRQQAPSTSWVASMQKQAKAQQAK